MSEEQSGQWAQQRLHQGVGAARRGDLKTAMECYESALLLKPQYTDALVARGAAHANKVSHTRCIYDYPHTPCWACVYLHACTTTTMGQLFLRMHLYGVGGSCFTCIIFTKTHTPVYVLVNTYTSSYWQRIARGQDGFIGYSLFLSPLS